MPQPPLPQLDRSQITSDQYLKYTPKKLDMWDGFYNYAGQDMISLYLAILTNMGLRTAISHVPIAQWLAAIQIVNAMTQISVKFVV